MRIDPVYSITYKDKYIYEVQIKIRNLDINDFWKLMENSTIDKRFNGQGFLQMISKHYYQDMALTFRHNFFAVSWNFNNWNSIWIFSENIVFKSKPNTINSCFPTSVLVFNEILSIPKTF